MKFASTFIVVSVLIGPASAAAEQPQGSAIAGVIRDESGGVLPGTVVTATHRETGRVRSAVSGNRGHYEISQLDTGEHEVEGVLPGFRGESTIVSVSEATATVHDIVMTIAPIAETVSVTRTQEALAAVPTAVAVIQRDTIEVGQRRASLDESLRGIPGVFVQNRRSYSLSSGVGLSIRAPEPRFGIRGLAILQDGIPITTADGTTEPGNVDLGSAGRIEVIRGPSSVLYGNAAGGVVNVMTEFSPERRLTLTPDIQFGSYGYNRQQLKAEGRAGSTDVLVNMTRFETDGFREHSHAKIHQANVVVRNQLSSRTELRGIFNLFDMPFAENPSFLNEDDARNNPRSARQTAIDQNQGEATTQGQGGVTIEHQFSGGQLLRATGWGVWRDVAAQGLGRVITVGRRGGGFRTETLGEVQLGAVPLRWTAGADLSLQNDDRNEFAFAGLRPDATAEPGATRVDQQENVQSLGPFVHGVFEVHPRWNVSAGVRYDRYDFSALDRKLDDGDQSGDRTMSAVSPSVGVTFLAGHGVNLYGSVSTAYETPTTVELSNRPTGEGGFNQDLDPQDLTSFEVGMRGLAEPIRLRFELALYASNLTNVLVPFQRPDDQIFFANAGESSRNGVEVLLEWVPDPAFSARFSYTYQDFQFDTFVLDNVRFDGNLEPGAPPHQVFVGLTQRAPFGVTSILNLRWVDRYTVNNANTAFNWAYTVVDLRFAFDRMWRGSDIRPFIGIDNLFDERYNSTTIANAFGGRYFGSSPGREVYGGFTIGFGVS